MVQVSLGADTSEFFPSPRLRAEFRFRMNLTSDEVVVVSSGRLEPEKEVDVLLKAIALVQPHFPRISLILASDAWNEEAARLRLLSRNLGIDSSVRFEGLVPHERLPLIYAGADIGVWPGAPSVTVLEALSAGLACVLPSSEGAYKPITKVAACSTFRRQDPSSLAEAILVLARSPALREELSKRARELSLEMFSWTAVARRLQEVYES